MCVCVCHGGISAVIVTVIRNGHSNQNSNPE